MKDLINMEYWREAHVLPLICPSDAFYVKYARKIRDIIRKADCEHKLSADDTTEIALTLTYYLEDVISGLGFWRTFVMEHKRMYGRYLPFYNTDDSEYWTDEINEQDICFLVWMIFQKKNRTVIMNPENLYLQKIAHDIFVVMDRDFELMPVNDDLLHALQNPALYNDFYSLKTFMVQVFCMSYLFYYFASDRRKKVWQQLQNTAGMKMSSMQLEYMSESIVAVHEKNGPLAIASQVWLSRILEYWRMDSVADDVRRMVSREYQPYLIVSIQENEIVLADWEDTEFRLAVKENFNDTDASQMRKKKMLYASLVSYKGKWHLNGAAVWGTNENPFYKFKEMMVETKTSNQNLYGFVFKKFQTPLFFFKDGVSCRNWFNEHIKDFISEDKVTACVPEQGQHIMTFFSEKSGVFVLEYGAEFVRDDSNPFYNPDKAPELALGFLFYEDNFELVEYLLKNKKLPEVGLKSEKGEEYGRQLLEENMDFLLRFMHSYS